ncbi:hypothetical protein CVD23_11945 [Bacillus sp. V33-4]|nr:hypothetical protein CVD23_11945 [Bacillus sp. V33-4]
MSTIGVSNITAEAGTVKIFIDPGHGGNDPGAVGNGIRESDINLQIASRIRDILLSEYTRVSILMSRENDVTVSLSDRSGAANAWGADSLVSVHINAGGGTGYEDYIHPSANAVTIAYRDAMHSEIAKQIEIINRGKKTADFHMVRVPNMPSILTENGYIDNSADAAKLKQTRYIEKIARGHVNGLEKALGLQPKRFEVNYIPNSEYVGKRLSIKTNGLWFYDTPRWDIKGGEGAIGHSFIITEELRVNGARMFRLHNNKYIAGDSRHIDVNPKPSDWPYQVYVNNITYSNAVEIVRYLGTHYQNSGVFGESIRIPFPVYNTAKTVEVIRNSEYVGKKLIINTNGLWFYDTPRWDLKSGEGGAGHTFIITEELRVNGSRMFKLHNSKYVAGDPRHVSVSPVPLDWPYQVVIPNVTHAQAKQIVIFMEQHYPDSNVWGEAK